MRESGKASPGALAASLILGALALLLWAVALATLSDLAGSDAAGDGYAQAYAATEIFLLWGLLAGVKGAMRVRRYSRRQC